MKKEAYDDFSGDYDRFVNWEERLSAEMPFLLEKLQSPVPENGRSARILDAACGTGMHAIALAKTGCYVSGADISKEMIRAAKNNARAARLDVDFKTAGFGALTEAFGSSSTYPFDAIICLGNSLPHLLSEEAILDALTDMAKCLRPGGYLLLQNRNFDAVMAEKNRWLGTQSHVEGTNEWLFLRFYDFDPDGLITFNIIRLFRDGIGPWKKNISTTRLFPLKQDVLLPLLEKAGFHQISCSGKMGNEPFCPVKSGNLVITAVKM